MRAGSEAAVAVVERASERPRASNPHARGFLCALVALTSCLDSGFAAGDCAGLVQGPIDLSSSFRTQVSGGEDDAVLDLSYAAGKLVVLGRVNGVPPGSEYEKVQPLFGPRDGTEFVEAWSVSSSGTLPTVEDGTIEFSLATSERLVGSFAMTFSDQTSVSCSFDLPRAVENETP